MKKKNKAPTVAIVARLQEIELPYLKSFTDHYDKLGVKHLYFACTNLKEYDVLKEFLDQNSSKCTLVKSYHKVMNHKQYACLPFIKEDYVAHFDCDEFLELPKGHNIPSFLNKHSKRKYFTFRWLLEFNDSEKKNSQRLGIVGSGRKYLIKTSLAKHLPCHPFKCSVKRYNVDPSEARLVHYWGRTFNDMLLKSADQKGLGRKKKIVGKKKMKELIKTESLPPRMKALAYHSLFSNTTSDRSKKVSGKIKKARGYYLSVNEELEAQLLNERYTQEEIKRCRKTYLEYKNSSFIKNVCKDKWISLSASLKI